MSEQGANARRLAHSEQAWLWAAGIALFVVGDLATTGLGLTVPGLREAGPLTGPVLRAAGPAAVLGLKLLALAGAYVVWRIAPSPSRIGVPLGLVVVGGWTVGWNLSVVLLVG